MPILTVHAIVRHQIQVSEEFALKYFVERFRRIDSNLHFNLSFELFKVVLVIQKNYRVLHNFVRTTSKFDLDPHPRS